MRLTSSIITLCGIRLAAAAVTLYGPAGPAKDHIECESITIGDFELGDLLEEVILRNASRSDTEFVLKTDLNCNSTLAESIMALCFTMPDTVGTCLPVSAPSQKRSKNTRNLRRNFPEYCRVDGTCTYTKEYEVPQDRPCAKGYVFGGLSEGPYSTSTRCQLPCTSNEKTRCTQASCDFHRSDCSTTGGVSAAVCGKALKDCSDPVAMEQSICNDQLISIPTDMSCIGCVSYRNGKCELDRAKYNTAYTEMEKEKVEFLTKLASSGGAAAEEEKCKKSPTPECAENVTLSAFAEAIAKASLKAKKQKQ